MKLLKYLIPVSALLLGACSNDENINPDGSQEVKATFHLNMPEDFQTRAGLLGQGYGATNMQVLVFKTTGGQTTLDSSPQFEFVSNETNKYINLDLLANNTYTIVFFVASPQAMPFNEEDGDMDKPVYSISEGLLTVNYGNMNSEDNNLDYYDCFYATYPTGTVGSEEINATVNLTRPVAQVNWGNIGNWDETTFGTYGAYVQTTFTATVPNEMNLLTGELTSSTADIGLSDFQSPSVVDAYFPVSNPYCTYIALQYILAPADKSESIDMTLTINNQGDGNAAGTFNKTVTVTDAPLQANYQTNIYGDILSETAGAAVGAEVSRLP